MWARGPNLLDESCEKHAKLRLGGPSPRIPRTRLLSRVMLTRPRRQLAAVWPRVGSWVSCTYYMAHQLAERVSASRLPLVRGQPARRQQTSSNRYEGRRRVRMSAGARLVVHAERFRGRRPRRARVRKNLWTRSIFGGSWDFASRATRLWQTTPFKPWARSCRPTPGVLGGCCGYFRALF